MGRPTRRTFTPQHKLESAPGSGASWLGGLVGRPSATPSRPSRGCSAGISADTTLCLGPLNNAVWERFPDRLEDLKAVAPQLSHDWGSQFTSRPLRRGAAHAGRALAPDDDRLARAERHHRALLRLAQGRGGLDHRVRHPRRGDRGDRRLVQRLPHRASSPGGRLNLCNPGGLKCQPPAGPLQPLGGTRKLQDDQSHSSHPKQSTGQSSYT